MNKPLLNYLVDICLAVSFIIVFLTGIVKFPNLLPSSSYAELPMRSLSRLHDWSGIALGVFALFHIILHWKFMTGMTRNVVFRR